MLAGGLGVAHYNFHSRPAPVSRLGVLHNRYEQAQHKTVLIVSPDGGQGTGVVIKRGDRIFVWTAAHVVYGFDHAEARIIIRNGDHKVGSTTFGAKVIALDSLVDAALLYVDAPVDYFVPAEFDSILPPLVGTQVYHVGNFLGAKFDTSVSTGVVSQIGADPGKNWLWAITDQFTAAISPGSSGGPVFNSENDKVVGLAVGVVSNFGDPVKVYIPVRVIEAWASTLGLGWAIRGDVSPVVLPTYTAPPPKPMVLLVPELPSQKKK